MTIRASDCIPPIREKPERIIDAPMLAEPTLYDVIMDRKDRIDYIKNWIKKYNFSRTGLFSPFWIYYKTYKNWVLTLLPMWQLSGEVCEQRLTIEFSIRVATYELDKKSIVEEFICTRTDQAGFMAIPAVIWNITTDNKTSEQMLRDELDGALYMFEHYTHPH